ncbi:MAG: serine/threonine protein kinase [bacterium]
MWLTDGRRLKLLDAGILQVRHTDRVWEDDKSSQLYVAPEQIQGMRLTKGCDNFLLGIMLYESLTGIHPFEGQNAADSRVRILADDPPLASSIRPEISGRLDGILNKSLSKDPRQRYQSISEFASDLRMASLDNADVAAHAFVNKN